MTLSLRFNARPIALFGALAWTTLTIGAAVSPAPAHAGEGAFYRAELAAPAAEPSAVAGGLVWKCSKSTCAAGKGTSRPAIICARLVREVGAVTTFTAGGKPLEAAELARCNGQ